MAEINLLGNENSIDPASITAKSLRIVSTLLFAALLLVLLSFAYFKFGSWNATRQIANAQEKTAMATAEVMGNPKRMEVITRQGQLKEANTLIARHMYWSYLLPEISRVTLNSAGYTRVSAGDDGKLELTVIVPTYQELEKYLQVYNLPEYHQQFSNVRVTSISKINQDDQLKIQAQIRLDFDPSFLKDRLR